MLSIDQTYKKLLYFYFYFLKFESLISTKSENIKDIHDNIVVQILYAMWMNVYNFKPTSS